MLNDKQLMIIMGAPRSGTTWLQAMVDSHPAVVTMSEMWVLAQTAQWMKRWDVQADKPNMIGLPLLWERDELLDEMRAFANRTYTRLLAHQPEATIILDKTPRYVRFVHHIYEMFPDVQFIHIIRDGRDVVASTLKASTTWGQNWATSDAYDAAEQWAYDVQCGREASQYTGHYTEIRYEDLIANDVEALTQVFSAAGVSLDPEDAQQIYESHTIDRMRDRVQEASNKKDVPETGIVKVPKTFYRKGQTGAWRKDLSLSDQYDVYRAVQPMLSTLEYVDTNDWWYDTPVERLLIQASGYLPQRMKHYWSKVIC